MKTRNDIYTDLAMWLLAALLCGPALWSACAHKRPRVVAHRCEFSTVLDPACLVDGGAR